MSTYNKANEFWMKEIKKKWSAEIETVTPLCFNARSKKYKEYMKKYKITQEDDWAFFIIMFRGATHYSKTLMILLHNEQ